MFLFFHVTLNPKPYKKTKIFISYIFSQLLHLFNTSGYVSWQCSKTISWGKHRKGEMLVKKLIRH